MEELLKKAAENMVWMADRIHQAYHDTSIDVDGTWRDCSRGVCGSMEHVLAQAGFDKHLNPIPVRP